MMFNRNPLERINKKGKRDVYENGNGYETS